MTVPTGSVLRASARFVDPAGSDQVNVWFFLTEFASPQDELVVFDGVDDYLDSVYQEWDVNLHQDYDPVDLKVDVVEWDSAKWAVVANVGFGSWGATVISTATADFLPAGNAILGQLFTGLGKHTGRKFFGGFVETLNTAEGDVLQAVIDTIVIGLTKLLTPFIISGGNTLTNVVVDFTTGVVREVIEVGASTVWSYQRRRRPGTGS